METAPLTRLYWIGLYNVLIPCNIGSVKAADGENTLFRHGVVTQLGIIYHDNEGNVEDGMSKEEYLDLYARHGEDGHYYDKFEEDDQFVYDGNDETDYYWVGPYGMLVPSTTKAVKAENGIDIHHSNGTITKSMTKEEYLRLYASCDEETLWFYDDSSDRPIKRKRLDDEAV